MREIAVEEFGFLGSAAIGCVGLPHRGLAARQGAGPTAGAESGLGVPGDSL
jgi:hypothetical protein